MILKTKVGEYYTPLDNSWAYCLQDNSNHYLAGTLMGKQAQTTTIVKGPYYLRKKWIGDNIISLKFVTVRCEKGLLHETLYHGRD